VKSSIDKHLGMDIKYPRNYYSCSH